MRLGTLGSVKKLTALLLVLPMLLTGMPAGLAAALTGTAAAEQTGQGNISAAEALPGTASTVYHEVSFALPACDGEAEAERTSLPGTVMVPDGTQVDALSTPSRLNCVFAGWYYDAALENMVEDGALVESDLTLYPRFVQRTDEENWFDVGYVAVRDVPADYAVTLVSYGLTPVEIADIITVTNINAGGEEAAFRIEPAPVEPEEPEAIDLEWLGLDAQAEAEVTDAIQQYREGAIQRTELIDILRLYIADDEAVSSAADMYAPEEQGSKTDTYDADALGAAILELAGDDELVGLTEEQMLKVFGLEPGDSIEKFLIEEVGLGLQTTLYIEERLGLTGEAPAEEGVRYLILPGEGAWSSGDLHSIEISDTERLRFVYDGEETDGRVTRCNFDVAIEDVFNISVRDNVKFVSSSEVEAHRLSYVWQAD